jgi:hypothetical protein
MSVRWQIQHWTPLNVSTSSLTEQSRHVFHDEGFCLNASFVFINLGFSPAQKNKKKQPIDKRS